MRKLFFLFSAAAFLSCQNSESEKTEGGLQNTPVHAPLTEQPALPDSSQFTSIEWLDADKDYGKVSEGQKVEVAFRFKNSGEKPLVIYSVTPTCGCTAAEPPKEPILPGQEGVIKGAFDSNGRTGTNNKSIRVRANTINGMDHKLNFKVEVEKKVTG